MSFAGLVFNPPQVGRAQDLDEKTKVEEHEFIAAINALINEGFAFGTRFITDSNARLKYSKLVKEAAEQIYAEVMSGKLNFRLGAERAHAVRNELLQIIRDISSDIGVALARRLKQDGRSFDYLLNHASDRLFRRPFSSLAYDIERQKVFLRIVETAGKSNVSVNQLTNFLGKSGRALGVVSITIMIYSICEAEDKWGAAAQEATGFALGSMLSMVGGWAGMACGPGAPICVPLGVFVGGALGALGADYLLHWRH